MTGQDGAPAFEALVADLRYPMFVVTAAAGGRRAGALVGFLTQCSIDPPRLLVCLSKKNHTYRVAREAALLVVHFLGTEDQALARLFGEQSGDQVDKFAACTWDPGPAGTPVLQGCRGWVSGQVLDHTDLGDHVGFTLALTDGQCRRPAQSQLDSQDVRTLTAGHEA